MKLEQIQNLQIDGKIVNILPRMTILQACEFNNIVIPKFCYHPKLSIAGNCRMCLIDTPHYAKLVAACATPCVVDMKVFTKTLLVRKARAHIIEFLLLNHPLDCPVCDQGGECDLQDQTFLFGSDKGRYKGEKRAVLDKECGVLVRTSMTRCIHCTKCIRFATEMAGDFFFGTINRGRSMEISNYVERFFLSELSGNVIDLCPVGALTSKPYAFSLRSWELKSIESIDILDGLGSNIRIDTCDFYIMRILPRFNNNINEEWLTDKNRFSFDGLEIERLTLPLIKRVTSKKDLILVDLPVPRFVYYHVSWYEAFLEIYEQFERTLLNLKPGFFFSSDLTDSTAFLLFKKWIDFFFPKLPLFSFLNYSPIVTPCFNILNLDFRSNYSFNSPINVLNNLDVCLLIGLNPRFEATLINAKLRQQFLKKNILVGLIGSPLNLTFPVLHLGVSYKTLINFCEGKHLFCFNFVKNFNTMIIFGTNNFKISISNFFFFFQNFFYTKSMSCLSTKNFSVNRNIFKNVSVFNVIAIFNFNFINIINFFNGHFVNKKNSLTLNLLNTGANSVGLFDIGYKQHSKIFSFEQILKKSDCLFFLGCDFKYDFNKNFVSLLTQNLTNKYIIFQGQHKPFNLDTFDLLLPSAAYTEKDSFYCNISKLYQKTQKALIEPDFSQSDSLILLNLICFIFTQIIKATTSFYMNQNYWFNIKTTQFKFDFFFDKFIINYLPYITTNNLQKNIISRQFLLLDNFENFFVNTSFLTFQQEIQLILNSYIKENYYISNNSIVRNSEIMAECNSLVTIKTNFNFIFF